MRAFLRQARKRPSAASCVHDLPAFFRVADFGRHGWTLVAVKLVRSFPSSFLNSERGRDVTGARVYSITDHKTLYACSASGCFHLGPRLQIH
eukprot:6175830-Pleurochrysis_carterae.AAC.4